jgi:hypothetical protein
MANWANDNLWGLDALWGDDDLTGQSAAAMDRLIAQFNDPAQSPDLQSQIAAHSDRATLLLEALGQILVAYRLGTSIGDQLDAIGERLDLDRLSLLDALYRIVLGIKAKSVLPTQSTAPQILEICRALIPAGRALTIVDSPPAHFLLTIEDITELEIEILVPFIRDAKAGGVGVHIGYTPVDALVIDSSQAPKGRDFVASANNRIIWANPGFSPDLDTPLSFACWIDFHSGGDSYSRVFNVGDAGDAVYAILIQIHTNGQLVMYINRATAAFSWGTAPGAVPIDDGYKSLVVTYNGTGISIGAVTARLGGSPLPRAFGTNGSGVKVVGSGSYMLGANVSIPTSNNLDGQLAAPAIYAGVISDDIIFAYEAGADPGTLDIPNLKFDPELLGFVDSVSEKEGTPTGTNYVDPPPLLQSLPHINPIGKIASSQGSGSYVEGKISSIIETL